jgi:hypothetical protein
MTDTDVTRIGGCAAWTSSGPSPGPCRNARRAGEELCGAHQRAYERWARTHPGLTVDEYAQRTRERAESAKARAEYDRWFQRLSPAERAAEYQRLADLAREELEPLDGRPVRIVLSDRDSYLRVSGVLLGGRRVQLVGEQGELVADLDANAVMVEGGGESLVWKTWKPKLDVEPIGDGRAT